jgi:hypothetical protein
MKETMQGQPQRARSQAVIDGAALGVALLAVVLLAGWLLVLSYGS